MYTKVCLAINLSQCYYAYVYEVHPKPLTEFLLKIKKKKKKKALMDFCIRR